MESNPETKHLEMRIVELETQLKELRAARTPASLTAEEISAYIRVINILRCINECTCGPCACGGSCSYFSGYLPNIQRCIYECNIDPRFIGGGGRFGGLGG